MLEQLRTYFKNTPKEEIINEWKAVKEECSNIDSPPILEFIEDFSFHFKGENLALKKPKYNYHEIINDPGFTRIFFYI